MDQKSLVRLCTYIYLSLMLFFAFSFYSFLPHSFKSLTFLSHGPKLNSNSPNATVQALTNSSLAASDDLRSEFNEKETTVDGIRRYTRRHLHSQPKYLILVLTKGADSWGYNLGQARRNFSDFLDLLYFTTLDLKEVSLSLLTSSLDQYTLFQNSTRDLELATVHIYLHPGYTDEDIDRNNRHSESPQFQTARRGEIAQLRNYLMLNSLGEEPHIIWLDSDIYELHSRDIIQRMVSHASNPRVGLITARCKIGPIHDYDFNTWVGSRTKPEPGGLAASAEGSKHVGELIEGTSDDDLIKLDSVGATILYIRSRLVHQGLSFPDSYSVGGTWTEAGWDGVESEGLCYRARGLRGGGCWLMGGKWHSRHTDR